MAILLGPGKPEADDADVFSVGGLQLFYVYMYGLRFTSKFHTACLVAA